MGVFIKKKGEEFVLKLSILFQNGNADSEGSNLNGYMKLKRKCRK